MRIRLLHIIVVFISCFALYGCSSPYIITVWKNQHAYPGNYNKIMIAAIVNNNDTSLRVEVENHFKETFESMGYIAVSSFQEFGKAGLHDLNQEQTFLRLCNSGIDAVVTVALTPAQNDISNRPAAGSLYPADFYYQHIWHYREMAESMPVNVYDSVMDYSWEMILFDLSTLQPHYIAETRPDIGTVHQSIDREFWYRMLNKMRKEKFLQKRPPVKTGLKAF